MLSSSAFAVDCNHVAHPSRTLPALPRAANDRIGTPRGPDGPARALVMARIAALLPGATACERTLLAARFWTALRGASAAGGPRGGGDEVLLQEAAQLSDSVWIGLLCAPLTTAIARHASPRFAVAHAEGLDAPFDAGAGAARREAALEAYLARSAQGCITHRPAGRLRLESSHEEDWRCEAALLRAFDAGDVSRAVLILAASSELPLAAIRQCMRLGHAKTVVSLLWRGGFSMRAASRAQRCLFSIAPGAAIAAAPGGGFPFDVAEMSVHLSLLRQAPQDAWEED